MLSRSALPLRLRFPRLKVSIRFTREGLIFILLSLAIGAAAVNTGNNVLYLIFSLMLGLIVVSGMISRRMLSGIEALVEFPERIFAETPTVTYISVVNKKKAVPSFGIRISLASRSFPEIAKYFFQISPGSRVSGYASATFHQRGVHHLSEIQLQTKFPFSFFLKIVRQICNKEIRVYPKVYKLPEEMISKFTDGLLVESPYRGDSAHLLHLRDYSPLDSRKRIHWKASAKNEKLLVKELQKEHGRDLYVYFDCYPGSSAGKSIQESALSLIASLALVVQQRGFRAKFCFPDASFILDTGESSMFQLLDYLSEVIPSRPSSIHYDRPLDRDSLVFHVRSRKVAPLLAPDWSRMLVNWVEDFQLRITQQNLDAIPAKDRKVS